MVKLNKIYTRTGDAGDTGLVDGSRRVKYDMRIDAFGTVDEANATIGMARLYSKETPEYDAILSRIQNDLFDLGADLATPYEGDQTYALRIAPSQTTRLEHEIDALNEHLAPLDSFVLPGGSALASMLHLARTTTRRAERIACEVAAFEDINPEAIKYLNRLSDLLFVLSRAANENGTNDVLWVPGKNR